MTEIENSNETHPERRIASAGRTRSVRPTTLSSFEHAKAGERGALRLVRRIQSAAPPAAILTAPFLLLIKIYQWTLSPMLHALAGPNAGCRFYPSCSCYAAEALRTHGVLHGSALAAWRLLRCNPFNAGGVDLVPPASPAVFHPAPARPRCERVA